MNAAANEFYSMGLVLATFQDALAPVEQVSFPLTIDLHLAKTYKAISVLFILYKSNSRIFIAGVAESDSSACVFAHSVSFKSNRSTNLEFRWRSSCASFLKIGYSWMASLCYN